MSYEKVERMFEEHQGAWSEAIFNEDAWYKYLQPLVEDGSAAYLSMLQGSKEEQRKWWLYNRFRYIDSKYNAGDALSDVITVRGYAEFSMATKLQSLKLGDASASYSNGNLTELYLGNNVLLRSLDVRNCPNLTQAVDISGCSNIENVYFDGTSITGLNLPNGGILKAIPEGSRVRIIGFDWEAESADE